jgi:hypothetical protein
MPGTPTTDPSRTARVVRGGFDALLAGALVWMLVLVISTAVGHANRRTELRLLVNEANALHDAFMRYSQRNHGFPTTYSASRFDVETFDPLVKRGYYRGALAGLIREGRADAYDSPDDRGPNREFWVELTLKSDPTIRVLVARSDDAPIGGGAWRDGVFVFRNGELDGEAQ